MRKHLKNVFILFICMLCHLSGAAAQSGDGFAEWKRTFLASAAEKGISENTLRTAAPYLSYVSKVIELDQRQPEKTQTFQSYLEKTVTPQRIEKAQGFLTLYHDQLAAVAATYHVSPDVIVALWAKESSFGQNQGNYSILSSLGTLAYEGRRAEFFTSELLAALQMLEHKAVTADMLTGSWAGAMGQCQFMPSSYLRYAVDGDGDGLADIWHNDIDVFASIANYLHSSGWQDDGVISEAVKLPADFDTTQIDPKNIKPVGAWHALGIRRMNGHGLFISDANASIVQPDGPGTPAYLAFDNFRVLMKWNRSSYFALAVAKLASSMSDANFSEN